MSGIRGETRDARKPKPLKKKERQEKRKNSPNSKNNKPDKKPHYALTPPASTTKQTTSNYNSLQTNSHVHARTGTRAKSYSYHVRRRASNDSTL